MRTIDTKFSELCDEIDSWKQEAMYWKQKYADLQKEMDNHVNESLKSQQETIGQIFSLVFRSEQTEDGILIKQDKNY